jgi:dephospho-CoA kinase
MWIIGLTGSIGAGKSVAAHYFRSLGVPVHCSDAFIHFLLEQDKEVFSHIQNLWPDVIVTGKIDRSLLGEHVLSSPQELRQLEGILYPKLAKNQKDFLEENQKLKQSYVVLDVPLLFEVGLDAYCDCVILMSVSPAMRKRRVLKRQGMTPQKLQALEELQMKDLEKKKKADFIIYSGREKGNVLKAIKKVLFFLSRRPTPTWQGTWPMDLKKEDL